MIILLKLWTLRPYIMEVKLIEFIYDNFELIGNAIKSIIFGLLCLYLFIKTKNINYLKGVEKVETKQNTNYVYDQAKQKFVVEEKKEVKPLDERFKRVYRLNKTTNELELTDEVIDIQELTNSCRDYCLTAVLERFLPGTQDNSSEIALVTMEDDLDVMSSAVNLANEYKEKYKLDPSFSVSQVFDEVNKRALKVKSELQEKQLKIKEAKDNAQKNEQESE